MESESSSSEEDHEAHLYSLIHHDGEPVQNGGNLWSHISSEEIDASKLDNVTSLYQSNRSKATRLDRVHNIISAADTRVTNIHSNSSSLLSEYGNTGWLNSEEKQQSKNNRSVVNNYSSLLNAYKAARARYNSGRSEKVAINESKHGDKERFQHKTFLPMSSAQTETRPNKNDSYVNDKLAFQDQNVQNSTVSANDNLGRYIENYEYSYSQNPGCQNLLERNLGEQKNIFNSFQNRKVDTEINKCVEVNKQKSSEEDDHSSSKYNICLNKDRQDSEECLIVLDSSESENSVVEVEPPVCSPPPLVSLSSDEAMNDIQNRDTCAVDCEEEDDIVVLYSCDKSTANLDNKQSKITSGFSSFDSIAPDGRGNPMKKRKKKKRKKGKNGTNMDKTLVPSDPSSIYNSSPLIDGTSCFSNKVQGFESFQVPQLQCSVSGMNSLGKKRKKKATKRKNIRNTSVIVPQVSSQNSSTNLLNTSKWTEDMSRFYDESWGGEDFDVPRLQRFMSDDPSLWAVSYNDIVPVRKTNEHRNKKCSNCNTWGHIAKSCPETTKPIVCLFCGKKGHSKFKCPTPVCLHCGKSAMAYNSMCPSCLSSGELNRPCNECGLTGHPSNECTESWRKYYFVTTDKDSSQPPRALYKPRDEQFCCKCAGRGHLAHECKQHEQQYRQQNSLKRKNNPKEHHVRAKRRKLNNGILNFPFNLFFQPRYRPYKKYRQFN